MMNTTAGVLLVDDNPADADLIGEVLSRSLSPVDVSSVRDGQQAIDFLRRRGAYASSSRPVLVVLDLSMPGKDGRFVLAEVKSDPELRKIPIVVFSTSQAGSDIGGSYDLGANSYVTKPCSG
jgi:two-component system, chemotaxis family, response regulator Rcp1